MSRFLSIGFVFVLLNVSCKKNRVCNCRAIINTESKGVITSKVYDYSYTINKSRVKTAVNSCVRTKVVESNGVKTTTTVTNCALK